MIKYILTIIIAVFSTFVLITCKKAPEITNSTNKKELPTLSTTVISDIAINSAISGGTITNDGNANITVRGVCWNTIENPSLDNNIGYTSEGSGVGGFTSNITGLTENTTYYVAAYATNEKGTAYGSNKSFSTLEISLPTLKTTAPTNIQINSAISGGNITNDGNSAISTRGVCWNTTGNPTLENYIGITSDGTGTGSYTSQITELNEETSYFVVAYATNEKGTGYGEVKQFSTDIITKPTVSTLEVTDITSFNASCGGEVTNTGYGTIFQKGICWNTTGNPTLDNNIGLTQQGSGSDSFASQLTGLTEYTTYYVAAYATNEKGTGYGQDVSFVATNDLYDPRDGQYYETVIIGTQTWMAENLNYNTGSSWCYNNDNNNCDVYGRLYDWETIMNGESSSNSVPSGVQGICPDGWHLPSDEEWDVLVDYLGGSDVAGGKMKEEGYEHWSSPNTGATNTSGFTALPGGYRYSSGSFDYLGDYGYWWSSTEYSDTDVRYRSLYYDGDKVGRYYGLKTYGRNVRCLKN